MRVICLGSGTSTGVPMIGCECPVCTSRDPRNRRYRVSVVISLPGGNLLIDTPPELRLACVEQGITDVSSVLVTHTHSDHIMGMDDIRQFNFRTGAAIPVFAEQEFLDDLRRVFHYVFVPTQEGGGKPKLDLVPIVPGCSIRLLGAEVLPLRVFHGVAPITSFRIGGFAYVTDASAIPPETMAALRGLDTLILGAIRDRPHSTHLSIAQGIEVVEQLSPRRAFFTHLTHDVDYEELRSRLPAGIQPAYDGLAVDVPDYPPHDSD